MKEFKLGTMYWLNPNYGAKEIEEDLRRIRGNNFNIIRSFVWWENVEPRKGVWDFRQHDMLFEAAAKFDIGIMETFGLYLPLWLLKELLEKGIDDRDRRYPCFDRPEVAEPMENFIRKTVERYKDASSLAVWNLWNEPTNSPCKCPATLEKFAVWLKHKYPTIEDLHRAWLGEFQVFSTVCPDSLDELTPAWLADAFEFGSRGRATPMESDWYAFTFDNSDEQMTRLRDIVRSVDPAHETHANPATPIGNSLHCGLNEWSLARVLDSISISVHPSHHFFCADEIEHFPGMFLYCMDEVRSWGQGKDAWIGELQAGTAFYHSNSYTPSPEELSLTLWHSLGRGLRGVLFWEWQAWRSSMMEVGEFSLRRARDGAPTERSEAAKAFGAAIGKRDWSGLSPVKAETAIFASMSARNLKFQQFRGKPFISGICEEHNHAVYGCHKALERMHIPVDFVTEIEILEDVLNRYKVLYVPQVEMIGPEIALKLRDFVEKGGALWADGRCGWLDEHVYLRYTVPGNGLDELFGCREADFVALRGEERIGNMRAFRHIQYLEPENGEVIAGLRGRSVSVRGRRGKGVAELHGSSVSLGIVRLGEDPATMDAVAAFALEHGAVPRLRTVQPGIIFSSLLIGKEEDVYILSNRRAEPVEIELHLNRGYRAFRSETEKLPGGTTVTVPLSPLGTAVLTAER